MAGSMSDYLEQAIAAHVFRTSSFSKPAVLAVALCTTAPTAASTGVTIVEPPSANGYSRQSLNPLDANWTAGGSAGARTVANASVLTFGPVTNSDWLSAGWFAICDSASYGSGNLLFWGTITTPKICQVGDDGAFGVGTLVITFA
jgi:hypothetical protein